MASWGSEEEEASPLLEVVTPEEHGVRGIKVSARILHSCCDETDSFLRTLSTFLHMFYSCIDVQTHLFMVLSPLFCHLPLCFFPLLLQLLLLPLVLLLLPWQQTGEKQQRAPAENPLKVCTFQQEKTRSTNRLKKKTLKGFLVWKSDIKMLLYASK